MNKFVKLHKLISNHIPATELLIKIKDEHDAMLGALSAVIAIVDSHEAAGSTAATDVLGFQNVRAIRAAVTQVRNADKGV